MKIEGKKISIRDWEAKDAETYRYWNTGKHLWMKFDGPYYAKMTEAELEASVAKLGQQRLKILPQDLRTRLFIADVESDKLIGSVSWYWQSKETYWKSIGIVIYNESFWSNGIGYEALSLWVDYLFEFDTQIVRLDLRTWSGNVGMVKLAEKLGFIEEARFRQARIVNEEYYDSIGMGILKSEWEQEKRRN